MKLLQQLYFISSPSGKEHKMSSFIKDYLRKNDINDFKVLGNQIYRILPNTPLVAAHMDQVGSKPLKKLSYNKELKALYGNVNIGADDKNGIWIILNLLKTKKDLSFIFSDQEEAGGNIDEIFYKLDDELIKSIKYCLVFDRRNGSDIIGTINNYCNADFENDIAKIGKDFNYKISSGIWSDCDIISNWVPCINLSCGYYRAHSDQEYTVIDELLNSFKFGSKIIDTLDKTYERVDHMKYSLKGKYNWRHGINTFDDFTSMYDAVGVYYCVKCGNSFKDSDDFYDHMCPICNSFDVELLDYEDTDGGEYDIKNSKEYYYCSNCDLYSGPDDYILGLEDSPELCKICGNVKYKFKNTENHLETCESCSDYESMLCDRSICDGCPYQPTLTEYKNITSVKFSSSKKLKNRIKKMRRKLHKRKIDKAELEQPIYQTFGLGAF